MNILKIKDVLITPQESSLTEEQCEMFNQKFRGKYVYCINWKYCVALEDMSTETFVTISQNLCKDLHSNSAPTITFDYDYLTLADIQYYIDEDVTEKINDVEKYKIFNNFIPEDITIDHIKKFRTWLASTLLTFGTEDSKIEHMLKYYANGMYDDTIKSLSDFNIQSTIDNVITKPNTSTCGCANGSNIMMAGDISICDPITLYRQSVYKYMIQIFSQIDYWIDLDPEFLSMFKLYIDGILKYNLPLYKDEYTTSFVDCTCQLKGDTNQNLNKQILFRLSQALQYMIEDNVNGNKKYITTALSDWSTYLYEKMEW